MKKPKCKILRDVIESPWVVFAWRMNPGDLALLEHRRQVALMNSRLKHQFDQV